MFEVEKLHDDFGARVTGRDLGVAVEPALAAEIWALVDEYSFLCFPDQNLNDDQQLAITRALGEPEPNHVTLGQTGRIDFFGTIGNIVDGRQLGNDDKRTFFQTGNNMWHTDSSFRAVPSKLSTMSAYEVPDEGGRTEFVSTRAAYSRLPAELRDKIDPLTAIHDYVFSRTKVHPDAVTPSHAASLPPVPQKLVRKNPANGAANYYVGSHAKEIIGWSHDDSRALLDDLLQRAIGPAHIHSHRWQVGDFVIWDNRCLLHRGSGYDADKYRRRIRQTRVAGGGSTLLEGS